MTVCTREFPLPPDRLYQIIVDPKTYPAWLVGARRILTVDDGWPAAGTSFRHAVGLGPVQIADRTSSRGVLEGRSLELLVRARPAIEAVVTFEVEPRPGGSMLTMTENPCGVYKLLAPLLQPLIRARNGRSLSRLDELVREAAPTDTST